MDAFLISYVLLWGLVVLLAVLVLGLAREIALLRRRLGPEPGALATTDGPKIGNRAPELSGTLRTGGTPTRPSGRVTLLVFVSPHCDACLELLPELSDFMRSRPDVAVFLVGSGPRRELDALAQLYDIPAPMILDEAGNLARAFRVSVTPIGLALDGEWIVRSKGIVNTREHLEALARFHTTVRRVGLAISRGSDVEATAMDAAPRGS